MLVAACGQPAPSPSAKATVVGSSPTAQVTASALPTASPGATPTPLAGAAAAAAECGPPPPTGALSQGSRVLTGQDGDYRFSYPADWISLGNSVTIPTNVSVSPQTFGQTGVAPDAKIGVDVVRAPDNSAQISAWVLKSVTSSTAELFGRELAWLKTQTQIKAVLDDTLAACIDGARARGFRSTWTFPDGEKTLVIYVAQRNGRMYEVQLTADNAGQSAALDEALRTWKFTSPAAGPAKTVADQLAATKFKEIGTSDQLDASGAHPNAATFKGFFAQATDRIWVLYELDDGIFDTVAFSWKRNGREVAKASFAYGEKTSFAWTWIDKNAATNKFVPGIYEVTATLKTQGDSITIAFTVE